MAATYTIESVMDRIAPDGKGGFSESVLVVYTIPEGYRGSVSIGKKDATVENVKKIVEADVAKWQAIYKLGG